MSQYNRTKKIYGNCLVKAPDGVDMFRCEMKKANWYLDRKLAKIITEEPFVIQLTFEPGGKGHMDDIYYLSRKENHCVVCGTKDLSILTKHHIVPYEYRKFFPLDIKQHSSHDVVPICKEHHIEYETQHALYLKRMLADIHNAPLNITDNEKKILLSYSYAGALLEHGEKMNQDRKDEMIAYIQLFHSEEVTDLLLQRLADTNVNEVLNLGKRHGSITYEKVKDELQNFVEMWRKHFIEAMEPKFMPVGWSVGRKIDKYVNKEES